MNRHCLLFLALLTAGASASFGAEGPTGSIEGTVTIQGDVARDEMKPAPAQGAPEAYEDSRPGGGDSGPPAGESEIENVVVYVSGDGGGPFPPPKAPPELVQYKKRLTPHVLPIVVGTTVNFPNKDDFNHNVFSLSSVNKFDLGLYKSGQSKSIKFDRPGQVKVYCNIHSQMRAIVQVLENPYFAKPKTDGAYKIENVPAGSYELVGWHEKFPAAIKKVTVKAGEAAKVDFSFP